MVHFIRVDVLLRLMQAAVKELDHGVPDNDLPICEAEEISLGLEELLNSDSISSYVKIHSL